MTVSIFNVYAPRGDGGERGMGPIMGYYSDEAVAESIAKTSGWWGGYGGVTIHPAMKIDGKVYLLACDRPIDVDNVQAKADEVLRKQTLANLTAEQKRVLGLEK